MNILVKQLAYILLVSPLAGAVLDNTGKRSILESLIQGINIPPSGIGLSQNIAAQIPSQSLAVQVPHPVPVPVPHPILVPVERPVPFPVDRPVPYPVPVIKKYFIPVPFKVMKDVSTAVFSGPGLENGPDLEGGPEITAESYRIYSNGAGSTEASSAAPASSGGTAGVEATSPAPTSAKSPKSAKRNSSFRIHVTPT